MTIAVLAEKPDMGRKIASAIGATTSGKGCRSGNGYVVTWAIGHMGTLAEPHQIRPEWRSWDFDQLPMIPDEWPVVPIELDYLAEQFQVVCSILRDPATKRVIAATDAGREGELIFRYVYELAGCTLPFDRLWLQSLTPQEIQAKFQDLRPGSDFDNLAHAARARAIADWLVGLNGTRAYSLAYADRLGRREQFSVGRVQTPTLGIVARNTIAIRDFVPEPYLEVHAIFEPPTAPGSTYLGIYERPVTETQGPDDPPQRLPADGEQAQVLVERARRGAARIASLDASERRFRPPQLHDLAALQHQAIRVLGLTAKSTLEAAQSLYERGLITYPRTDSRHLPQDVASGLGDVVRAIAPGYGDLVADGSGERPLGKRFVDDAKVSDHHAIIPCPSTADVDALKKNERAVYDLVCRRLLAAYHEDAITATTTLVTEITADEGLPDRYRSKGAVEVQRGWKVVEPEPPSTRAKASKKPVDHELPPSLAEGQNQTVVDARTETKKTRPPRRIDEASLVTAMVSAGEALEDNELSAAMRERGLGTPATRDKVIETLLDRDYITREGKGLAATEKGLELIGFVHPELASASMTGQWEAALHRVETGRADHRDFLQAAEAYTKALVDTVRERAASLAERRSVLADHILEALRARPEPSMATNSLYRQSFEAQGVSHSEYRDAVRHLLREGRVTEERESFQKDGKTIRYPVLSLAQGRPPQAA